MDVQQVAEDTVLHIVLGLVEFGVSVLFMLPVLLWPRLRTAAIMSAVAAAAVLYRREVTQYQAKFADNHFFEGWNPTAWSNGKLIEAGVPIGLLLAFALFLLVQAPLKHVLNVYRPRE